ncbi:MAG: hypothetical protein ACOC46_01770 [Pirellulales bacterium]
MSTAVSPSRPDFSEPLTPVLPPRYALGARHVAVCSFFAALFLYVNYLPLKYPALWSDVAQGRWILAHGRLPAHEPLLPLAEGMPVVQGAWLSQVTLGAVARLLGAEWLSNLFALVILATFALLARALYAETRSLGATMGAIVCAAALSWTRLPLFGPETFGLLCFVLLIWLAMQLDREAPVGGSDIGADGPVDRKAAGIVTWIAVPVLFAIWANVHGSFVCGLIVLACCFLGRAVEVGWQSRSCSAAIRDASVRRWCCLAEAAVAATLVNPYGFDLWIDFVAAARNANLRDVAAWQAVTLSSPAGVVFVMSWAILAAVLRHSRLAVRPRDVLLLAAFSVAVFARADGIGTYAVVFAVAMAPHFGQLVSKAGTWSLGRAERRGGAGHPAGPRWLYTLACGLVVWVAFALSGWSRPVLGGPARPAEQLYGKGFPLALAEHLRAEPPEGLVFNPFAWGGWLADHGPAGVQLFAAPEVQRLPRRVWRDYLHVATARPGWQQVLRRYVVRAVIVDRAEQRQLAGALRAEPAWRLTYEDEQALLFRPAGKESAP